MTRIKANWSEAEEERLKMLAASGASAIRIAAALNRPMNGIRTKARQLGVRLPTVRQLRAKVREMGVNNRYS